MKKKTDLADRIARQAKVPKGVAADRLDGAIHRILESLRKGQPAALPGLGTFTPGEKPVFRFEHPRSRREK